MKEKNAAEDRMAKVQAKLDEMQAQFDAAMAQKQVCACGGWLQSQLEGCVWREPDKEVRRWLAQAAVAAAL